MDLLATLCKHVIELFLNFMGDFVLRHGLDVSQESNMSKLFGLGSSEWRAFRDKFLDDDPKVDGLQGLFNTQLSKCLDFQHILPLTISSRPRTLWGRFSPHKFGGAGAQFV